MPGAVRFKAAFVEVKSNNDRLMPHQELWMKDLLQCGIDARVASLKYNQQFKDAKKKRKRRAFAHGDDSESDSEPSRARS